MSRNHQIFVKDLDLILMSMITKTFEVFSGIFSDALLQYIFMIKSGFFSVQISTDEGSHTHTVI